MSRDRREGFTLIELLTVIAIIAVLAGLTATVLPRMREKARITRVKGSFSQINTAMTNYFAKHNSFPPAYGYMTKDGGYFLRPYTTYIDIYGLEDMYDTFAFSYDTDNNGQLSLMEFLPIGSKNIATDQLTFADDRYNGNNLGAEVNAQLGADSRPLIYVPVNTRQAAIVKKYWIQNNDMMATGWDPADPLLQNLQFPPATYDAYVLISAGPGGNTGGVVATPPFMGTPPYDDSSVYHVAALRAYFLASRDLNDNSVADFDFEGRTQQDEAGAFPDLPDGTRGYGPLIYRSQ